MKKIKNKVKQHCSVRRFIRQLFSSFIKRQNHSYKADNKKIIGMLQNIKDSIEIIARQIARWVKSGE